MLSFKYKLCNYKIFNLYLFLDLKKLKVKFRNLDKFQIKY